MSVVRRLERFLSNGGVRVREWYEPVAREVIAAASVAGEIHLVLDTTKVSSYFRLLMVGVAYRRRVLPLVWTWVLVPRGHSSAAKQVAVLGYVRGLIPVGVQVSLVGDCEFGHTAVLGAMHDWHWDYALRQWPFVGSGARQPCLEATGQPDHPARGLALHPRCQAHRCPRHPDQPDAVLGQALSRTLATGDQLHSPSPCPALVSSPGLD